MSGVAPDEERLLTYFDELSNWGRWGRNDELGTLNLIEPRKRASAFALVSEGKLVSCARPIIKGVASDVTNPPLHFMLRSGDAAPPHSSEYRPHSASDYLGLAPHGLTVTHLDSLSHMFWNGQMYNGRPATVVTTESGAGKCGVGVAKDRIATRGVLLDIPRLRGSEWLEAGEPVFSADLEEAEMNQRVRVEEGDALLLRLGWYRRRLVAGAPIGPSRPGLHAEALPWLRKRGVALIASDASHDVIPSGYQRLQMPVHQIGIVAMGLWILDACNFEQLAGTCAELQRWTFSFVVAPLDITGGTASAVNPLALF